MREFTIPELSVDELEDNSKRQLIKVLLLIYKKLSYRKNIHLFFGKGMCVPAWTNNFFALSLKKANNFNQNPCFIP